MTIRKWEVKFILKLDDGDYDEPGAWEWSPMLDIPEDDILDFSCKEIIPEPLYQRRIDDLKKRLKE